MGPRAARVNTERFECFGVFWGSNKERSLSFLTENRPSKLSCLLMFMCDMCDVCAGSVSSIKCIIGILDLQGHYALQSICAECIIIMSLFPSTNNRQP